MDKGASPLVPSCTVHAHFQPVQHLVSPFLAILGQASIGSFERSIIIIFYYLLPVLNFSLYWAGVILVNFLKAL